MIQPHFLIKVAFVLYFLTENPPFCFPRSSIAHAGIAKINPLRHLLQTVVEGVEPIDMVVNLLHPNHFPMNNVIYILKMNIKVDYQEKHMKVQPLP